jgi:hypothetical protein
MDLGERPGDADHRYSSLSGSSRFTLRGRQEELPYGLSPAERHLHMLRND